MSKWHRFGWAWRRARESGCGISRVLPERVTLRLGDSILRLLWCECRVGAGRWRRVKNALTMEMLLSGQEA